MDYAHSHLPQSSWSSLYFALFIKYLKGLWRHLNFYGLLEILRFPICNLIRGLEGKSTVCNYKNVSKRSSSKLIITSKELVKASSLGAVTSSQQKLSGLVKSGFYSLSNQLTPAWFPQKYFFRKQIRTLKRVINYYMTSDPISHSRNIQITF